MKASLYVPKIVLRLGRNKLSYTVTNYTLPTPSERGKALERAVTEFLITLVTL